MRKILLFFIPALLMSQYRIQAGTLSSGSESSSNGSYNLVSTLGLPACGISASSSFTLVGGVPYPGIYVISEEVDPVYRFKLLPLSPNPTMGRVSISFVLPGKEKVRIEIFDITGRLVWKYSNELQPGMHQLVWDSRDLRGKPVSSGIYFMKFNAEKRVLKQKLLVVR